MTGRRDSLPIDQAWAALPGVVEVHRSEDLIYNLIRFVVIHKCRDYKYGASTSASNEFLSTAEFDPMVLVLAELDRYIRPWVYWRSPVVPAFQFFPRWDRFVLSVRRIVRR